MNELIDQDVVDSFIQRGKDSRRNLERGIKQLFEQGKIPPNGWGELWIKHFLHEISLMDSNNFHNRASTGGETDARIQSQIVAQRHFYLRHGIGKAGDITEVHPKAAGSSLLAKLANSFAIDVMKMQGVKSATACILIPTDMGMALVLTLLTLKQKRPKARYVVWPRNDQKSCFIPILTAGMEPVIIENVIEGDSLFSDVSIIKTVVKNLGPESILCVLSSTSCFAPRIPDKLQDIACICEQNDIPHIINNTYGVQSLKCMNLIEKAAEMGRVDAVLQSTEKNFLVPVGGTIITGFQQDLVQYVGKMYPGRASSSPIIDFVITMLSLGDSGYNDLLKRRKEVYYDLKKGLEEIGRKYGERCLENLDNDLSLALTLKQSVIKKDGGRRSVSEFGSYIFKGFLPTARVVSPHKCKTMGKYTFQGWGMHHTNFPFSYLTISLTVGVTKADVDRFLKKLERAFEIFTEETVVGSGRGDVGPKTTDSIDSSSDVSVSPSLNHNSLAENSTIPRVKKDKSTSGKKPVRRPSKCQNHNKELSNDPPPLKMTNSISRRVEGTKRTELRSSRSLTEQDRKIIYKKKDAPSKATTAPNSTKMNRKVTTEQTENHSRSSKPTDTKRKHVQNHNDFINPRATKTNNLKPPETSFWSKVSDVRGGVTLSGSERTSMSSSNPPSRSSSILSSIGKDEIVGNGMLKSPSADPSKMTFIVDI